MKSLLVVLLEIQDQLQVYHLQTTSYARHKALGKAYEKFSDLMDSFLETYSGKYGRPEIEDVNIRLKNLTDENLDAFVEMCVKYFIKLGDDLDPKVDADLQNIAADMLGVFNHLKYLLTLK